MKFSVASDLHLERGSVPLESFKNQGADGLVLAGDIVELRLLKKKGSEYFYLVNFFRFLSQEYKTVIWVPGNHEYFGCYSMDKAFNDTKEALTAWGLTNIHLVNNETLTVEGVPFHCTTLWTDFNRRNPMITLTIQEQMNDYRYIRGAKPIRAGSKINTTEIALINITAKEYLKNAVSNGKPCVIVTHHQPLMELLDSTYITDLDYAYANTDLQGFLNENENIKVWCAGHTHQQFDVTLGGQRFVTNCRGYIRDEYQLNLDFRLTVIEI